MIGEVIESAIWLDGTETKEQRKAFESLIKEAIMGFCQQNGYVNEKVKFTEKRPGEDRVPPVPKHIEKKGKLTDVRLLIAESRIIGKAIQPAGSFVLNLDQKDLERLRQITRRAHAKISNHPLTDAECDAVIEELGPETALDTLRKTTIVSQYH